MVMIIRLCRCGGSSTNQETQLSIPTYPTKMKWGWSCNQVSPLLRRKIQQHQNTFSTATKLKIGNFSIEMTSSSYGGHWTLPSKNEQTDHMARNWYIGNHKPPSITQIILEKALRTYLKARQSMPRVWSFLKKASDGERWGFVGLKLERILIIRLTQMSNKFTWWIHPKLELE